MPHRILRVLLIILDAFLAQTDFLDRNAVSALLDGGYGSQAWYLLNFAMWWKDFVK